MTLEALTEKGLSEVSQVAFLLGQLSSSGLARLPGLIMTLFGALLFFQLSPGSDPLLFLPSGRRR